MTKKLKVLFCIVITGSVSEVFAQDTALLTLDALINQVETTYPEVLKYEGRIQAYEARAEGATALMPPTFSAGVSRFPYNLMTLNEQGPMNQAGLEFMLEQMITHPQKRTAGKEYFQSLGAVEQSRAEWTKNELRTLAKLYYYQRQIAAKKLKVINESEQVLSLLITTAEDRYTYNQAELTTVFKARAKLEELKNMRLMQEASITASNIGINTLLNRDVGTQFSIDTALIIKDYTVAPDTFSRSDINAMTGLVESMRSEQKYMASFSKPDFGIRVQHMQMFGMDNQFSVMGMVTIPIAPWSSKMYKSDVRAAQYEIKSMQKEIESMQLMAQRMQAEKLAMLQYSAQQLNNYRNNIIPSFEKNLDANLLAFRQNKGDFFVVLDAWEMLLMKKTEELDMWGQVLKLQAEYEYETESK